VVHPFDHTFFLSQRGSAAVVEGTVRKAKSAGF
jgi:hypothetical protein